MKLEIADRDYPMLRAILEYGVPEQPPERRDEARRLVTEIDLQVEEYLATR